MNLSREVTNDNFPLSSTVDKTVDRSHRLSSSVLASLGVIEESDQLVCGPVFRTALVIDIVVYGLCRLAPSAIQKLSSRAKPNMRIGALLKELKSSYPVSGALQVSYDLSGSGNTIAQVPRSLDGSLSLSLRNGWLATSLLDLAGLSLPNWLLTRTPGGNQANLVCMVARKGTTRGFVMETDDVQVVGVGFIDFRAKEVNLRFKPKALRQQFIKIAQPFAVQGPLSHPQLRLTGAPVAGAVVEVLAFPFNLLDTIVQPGPRDPGRAPCRIIQTSRTAGGLLNLPIGGRQGPLLNGPLLGRSSPLRAPLAILKQPLFSGPSR